MDFSARSSRESTGPKRELSVRRQRASGLGVGGRCAMKFLTPQALAAAVIGRAGSCIVEMERSSQAVIAVSKVNELYPKSECRVLTAMADTEQSLDMVARQLLEKLAEVVNRSQVDGGQLRISVLVPLAVVVGLVRDGGKGIRQVCEKSGATVKIKDPVSGTGPDASQELQLRGCLPSLGNALQELNREIQVVNSEPWFYAWAISATGVAKSGGPGESAFTGSTKEPSAGTAAASTHREARQLSPERSPDGRARSAMKVLVPPVLANILTGPSLAEIEQKAQAKLRLSDPEECFPRTNCRVLTARADSEESLCLVARWFVERLVEVAETDPSDAVVWEDKLKLSVLMPKVAASGFMGRGGGAIKQLCNASGAVIRVGREVFANGEPGPDATQRADVKGTAKSFEQVIQEVNSHVNALRDEPWFQHWASAPSPTTRPSGTSNGTSGPSNGTSGASNGTGHSKGAARQGALSPAAEVGTELVGRTMERLPRYVLEESRGFALTCVVPARLVGSVMGRAGQGLREVESATKTRIAMREIPGDADNRSMNIAGPLLGTCSAYMLMMKRYLDAEKEVMNGR